MAATHLKKRFGEPVASSVNYGQVKCCWNIVTSQMNLTLGNFKMFHLSHNNEVFFLIKAC